MLGSWFRPKCQRASSKARPDSVCLTLRTSLYLPAISRTFWQLSTENLPPLAGSGCALLLLYVTYSGPLMLLALLYDYLSAIGITTTTPQMLLALLTRHLSNNPEDAREVVT